MFTRKHIFLALLTVIVFGCSGENKDNKNSVQPEQPNRYKVQSIKVDKSRIPLFMTFSGNVSSSEVAVISPRVMGYIEKINYKPGESFKKGAVLVEIRSNELNDKKKMAESGIDEANNSLKQAEVGYSIALSQKKQMEANFELSQKTYDRYKNLLKTESVSKQEFDQVEAQFKSAKEGLEAASKNVQLASEKLKQVNIKKDQALTGYSEAQTYIGFTKVTAPFDGVVLEKNSDLGSLAAPGQPVLKIGTNANVINAFIGESEIDKVKLGSDADVTIPSINVTYKGKIIEISPNIDPNTRNFTIKISGDKRAVNGAYVKVNLKLGEEDAVIISKNLVVKRGQLDVVFVNVNGKAEMRIVKLGSDNGDKVRIISGLEPNDVIISGKLESIKSGDILEG